MPHPSPEIPELLRKMLADNAKAATQVKAVAQRERTRAAKELVAAQAEYERIRAAGERLQADFYRKFLKEYRTKRIANAQHELVPALHQSGYTMKNIAKLLALPLEAIRRCLLAAEAPAAFQRDDLVAGQIAKISYTSQGRGGDVVLEWGGQAAKFWWEFAGGEAVALIGVPSAAHWEAQTGIALAEREAVLHLIGRHTVRNQSPGGRYAIEENCITIY